MIGGVDETQEMLVFCVEYNIVLDVEMIDMQDANIDYERMEKSDVKYWFWVDMSVKMEKSYLII